MGTVQAGSTLAVGLALTDLDIRDLWIRYIALGGSHNRNQLGDYLHGISEWSVAEHDIAAHAINEYTSDHGQDHPVQYSDEV
jgi:hypothetical protein